MGYFPRFTYSQFRGECEKIVYGGCGGSANLFLTNEDCEATCSSSYVAKPVPRIGLDIAITFPSPQDICTLPPTWPGKKKCRSFEPKWTFSTPEGACVQYYHGGCRASPNLFDTKDDCEAKC